MYLIYIFFFVPLNIIVLSRYRKTFMLKQLHFSLHFYRNLSILKVVVQLKNITFRYIYYIHVYKKYTTIKNDNITR